MKWYAIVLLILASIRGFADEGQNRKLTGNVECLKALSYSAEGKVHNVLGPMVENNIKAVGFKGERDGKRGVYIYTANSAKFYEFPSGRNWFGNDSKVNIEINGQPYSIRDTNDPVLDRLVGTVFVDKPQGHTPLLAGKDILDDSTANMLADEVRTRTEKVWPSLKKMIEANSRPAQDQARRRFDPPGLPELMPSYGPPPKRWTQEEVDHNVQSYVKSLQTCQDHLILSQKASSDLAEMKAMDTSKLSLYSSGTYGSAGR